MKSVVWIASCQMSVLVTDGQPIVLIGPDHSLAFCV